MSIDLDFSNCLQICHCQYQKHVAAPFAVALTTSARCPLHHGLLRIRPKHHVHPELRLRFFIAEFGRLRARERPLLPLVQTILQRFDFNRSNLSLFLTTKEGSQKLLSSFTRRQAQAAANCSQNLDLSLSRKRHLPSDHHLVPHVFQLQLRQRQRLGPPGAAPQEQSWNLLWH